MAKGTSVLLSMLSVMLLTLFFSPADADAQNIRNKRFRFQNRLEHDMRPYNFGFTLGANTMNFAIHPHENLTQTDFIDPESFRSDDTLRLQYVLPEKDFGFHIGIVSNLKLGTFFDLRFIPTISFGDRHIDYFEDEYREGPSDSQDMEVTMLEFPLHVKYKSARMVNTRAYVIGGFKYTHDLRSLEGLAGGEDPILVRVGRNDLHYELG
ncbi:MAG: outer membrane beta-barrel protein, partial [Bacteroidales bacterium]